jgi:hypothetical protein
MCVVASLSVATAEEAHGSAPARSRIAPALPARLAHATPVGDTTDTHTAHICVAPLVRTDVYEPLDGWLGGERGDGDEPAVSPCGPLCQVRRPRLCRLWVALLRGSLPARLLYRSRSA